MGKIPFYIITSDPTAWILNPMADLYNKYWQPEGGQYFKVLGHNFSEKSMPSNFECVKIKDGNNIHNWTREIYEYIKNNEQAEYFIFSLDDYLPNSELKPEIIESLLTYAKKVGNVGRISLGRLDVEKWDVVEQNKDFDIVQLTSDSLYRISCQTSIWNREYFLKYFQNNWTPWQLELEGSKQAKTDAWKILGTNRGWAFGWVEESALSGRWPGMVNILGMRSEDVKYAIDQKYFKPEKLQYGIWYDCKIPFISRFQSISKRLTKIPKFSEIGYNFKWKQIKPYIRSKTFKRLYFRYKDIYKDA